MRIRLYGPARTAFGAGSLEVESGTVGDLVRALLVGATPVQAAIVAGSGLFVNGEPAALETHLGDGDELAVLPPVSGGSGDGPR